jgi:hypothetical protein
MNLWWLGGILWLVAIVSLLLAWYRYWTYQREADEHDRQNWRW